MQAVGEARRNDEGVAGAETDGLCVIAVGDLTAANKADLKIIVIMAFVGKDAVPDRIDMIVPLGCMEMLQSDQPNRVNPSFFDSISHRV